MEKLTADLEKELFPGNVILVGYRGSIAHNMYIPNTDPNSIDDIDLMGVFMAPVDHYIGLNKAKETVERFVGKWDVVSYEFCKFVRLLLKSNPNVMSLLWLDDEYYIGNHPVGRALINNRNLFCSKIAYDSFLGYASAQLKKMEAYTVNGYMGEKRKALVDKYGYDCKNAAHCIRLLRMGIEFLETGRINVFREDAAQLLEIKRGEWTLEAVKEEAERLFTLAHEASINSKLPAEPDYDKVSKLVKNVILTYIIHNA